MNRKEVTDYIVDGVNQIIPGDTSNGDLIRKHLDALSKEDFDKVLRSYAPCTTNEEKRNRGVIPFYRPNLAKAKYNIVHLYRLCEKMGFPIEMRLVMKDPITGTRYLTPHPYPVMDFSVGRQSQTISKKRSIPDRTQAIDDLTGQPTSTSKGSRISSPEVKGIGARGLTKPLVELVHVRGGSVNAYRELVRQINDTGTCTTEQLAGLGPAKSVTSLAAYLNCCHIGNNIDPRTPIPPEVYR